MVSIETIRRTNARATREMEVLLRREGIAPDPHLEESIGAYDDDGALIATGSLFGRTLRCLAVDGAHRGEGLMALIVGELLTRLAARGVTHAFVYTKPQAAGQLRQLGFYEIARVEGRLAFLENRRGAFDGYLSALAREKKPGRCAAVVMNANPFTLGHRYLLETAARENDWVHCFVVSEDASLVPFDVRMALVQEGAADLPNVLVHPSGDYIISAATFPSYFLKGDEDTAAVHAALDAAVFARIAHALDVTVRYVGEEPYSRTTAIYNDALCAGLPREGVEVRVVPRRQGPQGKPVSASEVRQRLKDEGPDAICGLVPESTRRYFASPAAEPVLARIRAAAHVRNE